MKKQKVILVMGAGRSGTTLVDMALGSFDNITSTGELGFIWKNGYKENRNCSCGEHFYSCPLWRKVAGRLDEEGVNIKYMYMMWNKERKRHRSFLTRYGFNNDVVRRYNRVFSKLYKIISNISEGEYIVDSCSHPSHVALISESENIDVRALHIVRDPRAVANSWRRDKKDPSLGKNGMMNKILSPKVMYHYNVDNIIADKYRKEMKSTLVKYESFAQNPKSTMKKILSDLEVGADINEVFVEERTLCIGGHHLVAGNPTRFKSGRMEVYKDEYWGKEIDKTTLLVSSFLGSYRMWKYNYI